MCTYSGLYYVQETEPQKFVVYNNERVFVCKTFNLFFRDSRLYNSDYMICFSRGDKNKEIFSRKPKKGIKSKLRSNFNTLVRFENDIVHCKNGINYKTSNLCDHKWTDSQKCTLKTGEEVILDPDL